MKRSLFPLIVFVFVAAAQAQNASAEFVKGNQFFDQKNYVAAAEAYTRCIGYDPNHASCYMNRGLARQIGIGYGLALDDFTKLISIRPDAKAYRLRGGVYNSLKRYNDAIADFDSSLRLNPRESMAYQGRGLSYEKLGDTEKAIADYSQAAIRKRQSPTIPRR